MASSGSPPKKELWSSTRGACSTTTASRGHRGSGGGRSQALAGPGSAHRRRQRQGGIPLHVPELVGALPRALPCQLEGYDSDWVDADARRVAYYTNLPPGHYRFRVIAANDDGVWNREGASLSFVLLPHFYQTEGQGGRLAVLRSAPPFLPDRLVSRRVGGALPAGGPRRTEALHAAVARARRRIGADGRRTHAGSANAKELPAAGHRYDPQPHLRERSGGALHARQPDSRRSALPAYRRSDREDRRGVHSGCRRSEKSPPRRPGSDTHLP